jgi:hypothetical protein
MESKNNLDNDERYNNLLDYEGGNDFFESVLGGIAHIDIDNISVASIEVREFSEESDSSSSSMSSSEDSYDSDSDSTSSASSNSILGGSPDSSDYKIVNKKEKIEISPLFNSESDSDSDFVSELIQDNNTTEATLSEYIDRDSNKLDKNVKGGNNIEAIISDGSLGTSLKDLPTTRYDQTANEQTDGDDTNTAPRSVGMSSEQSGQNNNNPPDDSTLDTEVQQNNQESGIQISLDVYGDDAKPSVDTNEDPQNINGHLPDFKLVDYTTSPLVDIPEQRAQSSTDSNIQAFDFKPSLYELIKNL